MKGYDKQSRPSSLDEELEMENVYVVDTSVIIADPDVFCKLGRHRIIVPIAVKKELNGLKLSTVARKADAAAKQLQTNVTQDDYPAATERDNAQMRRDSGQ